MKIIIDAMSGDNAPQEIVAGAVKAADELGVEIVFVGRDKDVRACLGSRADQFEIVGISERDSPLRTRVFTKEEYSNYSDLNRCGALMQADGTIKSTYMRIFIRNKHPEEPKGAVNHAD